MRTTLRLMGAHSFDCGQFQLSQAVGCQGTQSRPVALIAAMTRSTKSLRASIHPKQIHQTGIIPAVARPIRAEPVSALYEQAAFTMSARWHSSKIRCAPSRSALIGRPWAIEAAINEYTSARTR
jgi:hypothetical protein